MGSYLTIVNDTSVPWHCRIGPDMNALKWTIILILVKTIGFMFVVGTTVAPVALAITSAGMFGIFSVPVAAMGAAAAVTVAGVTVAGASTIIGISVSHHITKILDKKGYTLIKAGEKKRHGKMTLSLWVQSECIHVTTSGTKTTTKTLFMRPIFSGSTAGSNRDHSIKWWLDNHGITSQQAINAYSHAPPRGSKLINGEDVKTLSSNGRNHSEDARND